MLTILFMVMMIAVFGRFIALAIRMSWGITKIILGLFFFPVILTGLALSGLFAAAFPILIIAGIASILLPGETV